MLSDYFHTIWDKYRVYFIIGGLLLGILIILFLPETNSKTLKQDKIKNTALISCQSSNHSYRQNDDRLGESKNIYVDVKGAVHHPGAYQVNSEQRVGSVIQKAGGYTDNADISQVNLARKIKDQMIIYVPQKGEKIPIYNDNLEDHSMHFSGDSSQSEKINLNLATIDQLKGLTGIGEKKAQKIIEYRQQHGQFKSVEELKNVNGFGEKSVATIIDQVCV